MALFLLLVLEGPLLSFGREAVDARGPVADFPAASMLTGLLANALGWRREQRDAHDRLQARLRFGARLDRDDRLTFRFQEFQTAMLGAGDRGWTTRGAFEGRDGRDTTYNSPYIRKRDFDADARVSVALRLDPAEEAPDLGALRSALAAPARPLFLGRKSCLPARPVLENLVEAENLLAALAAIPQGEDPDPSPRILLPPNEPGATGETILVSDLRDWRAGLHGGQRPMRVHRQARGPHP